MVTQFDVAQSFYLESSVVDNAVAVHITSVELYFEAKPAAGKSATGIFKPGASIYLCPMSNDQPDLQNVIQSTRARLEWDSIIVDGTATTSTKFSFTKPILVSTDAPYAFLVSFDGSDNSFNLWQSQSGETFVNTSTQASVSAGYNDGNFYKITNGSVLTKTTDADLKFKVNIAKFSTLSQTYSFKEKKYEFFSVKTATLTGDFKVGEYVWQNTTPQTGAVSIAQYGSTRQTPYVSGSGTNFSANFIAGDYIVISDGTPGNTMIRVVSSVTNTTYLTLDEWPNFTSASASFYKAPVAQVYANDKKSDHMILVNSNANSSLYFANNGYIKGEDSLAQVQIQYLTDLPVQRVVSQIQTVQPGLTSVQTTINFANSSYQTNGTNVIGIPAAKRFFVDTYPAVIGTRSLAMTAGGTSLFGGATGYTVSGQITLTSSNKYSSPYIEEEDLDIFTYRYELNNDATNEETGNGNATTKYVSRPVTLGEQQDAEDLSVFMTAFIPQNASVNVYGKFLNDEDYETLDSKNWTLLEEVTPEEYISSSHNKMDTIEKQYRIPRYYSDETVLSGHVAGTTTSAVLDTTTNLSGTVNSTSNSLVRVYNEGAPDNFFVDRVISATSSTITLANPISNGSFNTSGLKIGLISDTNKNSAFINPQNKNVVRYYTNSLSPKDTYKVYLMKIVLLSPDKYRAPLVQDIRAIAVSA